MTDRPAIPERIKRAVRKKCAFGCIICGLPIYHYEHIEEYATVKVHEACNIVLLCPTHHQEKTSHRLSKAVIKHFALSPFNSKKVVTSPHLLRMVGQIGRLELGGSSYSFNFRAVNGSFAAIKIHGKEMVGLIYEDGHLLLNVALQDRAGNDILVVKRGEMTISTGVWDYRIEGPNVKIRSAEDQIGLEMALTDNGIKIRSGLIVKMPHVLIIHPEHYVILPENIFVSGTHTENYMAGIVIE